MASRLAISSLKAAARPRVAVAVPNAISSRSMSTSNPPPSERASEIINKLPSSPNLITKTGTALLGTGLAAAAISQELYVVNEETIVLVGSAMFLAFMAKAMREPYVNWAESQVQKIKGVLDAARAEHTQSVKDRIDSVGQMKDVVALTQSLFALSKETAQIESEVFVQRQKVAMASELKSVLDSWVRYEQQQKESEQAELTKAVIEKVLANLKEEKTQRDLLLSAVAEVEQMVKNKAI
ncbi:ATP4, subunit B of the stator stalk of mitochondrial F1F0 ATP synthase [Lentinula detonsa]|uniref:ATP synthase subunit 4 n=1 Tax=Lentinula detonsa TaxID=2804962 RepID=A0AA38PWV1_9AGAR|nr:ATP4, subunit B of the stator stalk of mitochondrial F1F0 ATP synthase [Lentinula detonsa]